MKTLVRIAAVLAAAAAMALIGLSMGCASLSGSKAVAAAKQIDKAALVNAAAAGARGDYAKALAEIAAAAKKKRQATIELDEAMKAAGFVFARTLYFDGALIEDHSRFSMDERWSRKTVGAGAVSASAAPAAAADDEEWLDEVMESLSGTDIGAALVGD